MLRWPCLQISLVGGFFTWMCAKDEAHLLAVGLPDAGKTCLLEHAKRAFNRKHHMVPLSAITKTIGMNISTLQMPGLDVIVWDVGGKVGPVLGGRMRLGESWRVWCGPAGRPPSRPASLLLPRHALPFADAQHLEPVLQRRGWAAVCV